MLLDGSRVDAAPTVALRETKGRVRRAGVARPGREAAARASALGSRLDRLRLASVERLLAGSRLFVAVALAASVATDIGPFHPMSAKLLMAVYCVYAAAVLAIVRRGGVRTERGARVLDALDLAWATAGTSLSGGTSSNIFALFPFALAGSAYRWGLRRTLVEASLVVAIAFAQAWAALAGLTSWPFEFDLFVLRTSFVAMAGVLFGVLSERRQVMSSRAATLGRLLAGVGRAGDLRSAVGHALDELVRSFGARQALLAVHEPESHRLHLWRAEAPPGAAPAVSLTEAPIADLERWFFPIPPNAAALEVRSDPDAGSAAVTLALGGDGGVLENPADGAVSLPVQTTWRSAIAAVIDAQGVLDARLFLVDPTQPLGRDARLTLLQDLVHHATPAFLNLHLVRRLRSRAELQERARLSAELHDGLIQTLIALEMRLELLRGRAASADPTFAGEVASARDVFHEEALRTRELFERLRPADADVEHLLLGLTTLVRRFSQACGIEARLDWTGDTLDLTRLQCHQVFRIVQEALVNVRRHSGASRVLVHLGADEYDWALVIEDNGRGLGFTGRLTHDQMDREQVGPRVIRQHVAALGAAFAIESSSSGLRLEVAWPRAHQA
jgi:signal transduction histidine kinase